MKKYLLWLLAVSIMSPLLSLASASVPDNYVLIKEWSNFIDRVDFSSYNLDSYSNFIYVQNFESVDSMWEPLPNSESINCRVYWYSNGSSIPIYNNYYEWSNYFSDIPFSYEYSFWSLSDFFDTNWVYTLVMTCNIEAVEDEDNPFGWMVEVTKSYFLYWLPVWSSSSDSILPDLTVPSSFTSWITQLVENFGWSIANWLPIVILVTLWITAIFALFRVVRGYAKRSFKW